MFLPPNVTALIQPMDQNALKITKLHYRNSLLSFILCHSKEEVGSALKKISLKFAVETLAAAWQKLEPTILQKCWKKIRSNEEYDDEDELPLSTLQEIWRNETEHIVQDTLSLLQEIQPVSSAQFGYTLFS